ncbi:carboxypeptidase-like regulatory domain-containing protein [Mucilaginibacter sp. JRF]|uniref:carboxypeptidase-like regulatory domain-containing protein n=1 Tax=Mucilaginibacter sp. JRF TaxID=2780088 RepID=UPI0018808A82|nr:carboxypeptidase-like regulatory domain-containing protein [Mucilaginibacter sp. JRF]MBE9583058.1 carboxypeptidase-like regulatory domain-containing protein [Mucilaginibacter sp. JRF]
MARLKYFTTYLTIILLIGFCGSALAQDGTITGKITTAGGKQPMAKASVFLNNATFGTTSADDGTFTLRGVKPGQYQLVITSVGYQEEVQTIMVSNKTLTVNIDLRQKSMMLREVVIMTDADWKKNYEIFKEDFIGTSENSKKCYVVNPRVVSLSYKSSKKLLEAYTDEFLVVENRALGYRVKYMINDFKTDKLNGIVSYEGRALFEQLPGSESQKQKWRDKRKEAYYGSAKHFFRSVYADTYEEDGFIVKPFMRELNPARAPEELIQRKIKQFRTTNRDSANYWINMVNMPKFYHEVLGKEAFKRNQFFFKTDDPGVFGMGVNKYLLYVIYTKKHEETNFRDLYRPLDMENFETSVMTFSKPVLYFDMNGRVLQDPPMLEGTWSKAKLAELLPLDYMPGD